MTTQEKNEDLKGRGGGRLKHYNVDGDVPLCLRKLKEKAKTAAAIKRTTTKKQNGERKQRFVRRFDKKEK